MDDRTNGWMDDGTDGWNDASRCPLLYVIIILFYFTHTYCRWHSGHHQALGINRTEPIPPSVQRRRRRRSSRFLLLLCIIVGSPTETDKEFARLEDHSTPMESEHCQTTNKQHTPPMKVRTKMSSNLCCLGEKANLLCQIQLPIYICTTKNMSLEGRVGVGGWWDAGFSRSRVRTNGVKGAHDMKSERPSHTSVPMQVALVVQKIGKRGFRT
jgi:hypothetical protein